MGFDKSWRHLSAAETESLIQQQNCADDWNDILVADTFCVAKIHSCGFFGTTYIGSDVTLYHVSYIENYYFDDGCRVLNVHKMTARNGEGLPFRFQIAVRNENGEHTVYASPDMTMTGACLMAQSEKYSSVALRLASLTSENEYFPIEGIGYVGEKVSVENVNLIEDAWIEACAVVSECAKLQNTFIHSSAHEPTTIGVSVILMNVIIGNGSKVDTGAMARNTFLSCHVSLTDYARVTHCVIGDNSHIACCEVLHSFVFPFHEQHHNNSFLIASLLKGQSNIAAGATIGSNHNGRANDCEMIAGRGFWAGLCTSVKFPSSFASYTLLAKNDYPYELRQPFPFSLVNNNLQDNVLEIMPAYWWRYNTYALFRNAWKYKKRDYRVSYSQHIQYKPIEPDTVQEILYALPLLQQWCQTQTLPFNVERSHRSIRLLKATEALTAYREMLLTYCLSTLHSLYIAALQSEEAMHTFLHRIAHTTSCEHWLNVGGQLVLQSDMENLKRFLAEEQSAWSSWQEVSDYMNGLYRKYEVDNQSFAFYILNWLLKDSSITATTVEIIFSEAVEAVRGACERALSERERDLHDEFRMAVSGKMPAPHDEVVSYIESLLQHNFSKINKDVEL